MFTSLFRPNSDHVMIQLKVTCTTVQIILPGTTDYIGACTNRTIINHAAMGRARFLSYSWFFFFMSVTRHRPPLSEIVFETLEESCLLIALF